MKKKEFDVTDLSHWAQGESENKERDTYLQELADLLKERDIAIEEGDCIQQQLLIPPISEKLYVLSFSIISFAKNRSNVHDRFAREDLASETAIKVMSDFIDLKFDAKQSQYALGAIFNYIRSVAEGKISNYMKKKEFSAVKSGEEDGQDSSPRLISYDQKINEEGSSSLLDMYASDANDPVKELDSQYLFNDLMEILNDLVDLEKSNTGKQIINLTFIEKLKGNEIKKNRIAEILGCSPSFVSKKEREVMKKLKEFEYLKVYLE